MHLTHHERRRLAKIAVRARESAVPAAEAKKPARRRAATVAPAEDAAEPSDEMTLDRRRWGRLGLASSITIRPIGGFNYQARLADVSVAGCRVELVEEAEPGEALIARFPQLEPLVAEVRWMDGATTGLEFTRPVHPAVFDALVERLD